jgi:ABC-type Na+ efflux pump permease subunit
MSQDVCSTGISGSVSTLGLGISAGKHVRDLNCERIKLSKVLFDYGMKVAAVSILCQDERVFEAMQMAGTPCPFEGKIGKEALEQWDKYDVERPDYNSYVSKLENRSRIDEELAEIARQEEAEKLRLEQEALARKVAEEKAKLETLKQQEEVDNIIIETDLETKEQRVINVHSG